ncbi:MAG: hypothetical protein ACRD4O_03615 [Bryobacteraceae bacterium]
MRKLLAILAIACALPAALPASEFDWLVREFSRESGATAEHIPFLWLARAAVAVVGPAGTSELHLAIFEHTALSPQRFGSLADEAMADGGWKPIVRVRSRYNEATNIYAQQEGRKHLRLLIATLDHNEATFVEVRIQPQELIQFIDEHRGNGGRQ